MLWLIYIVTKRIDIKHRFTKTDLLQILHLCYKDSVFIDLCVLVCYDLCVLKSEVMILSAKMGRPTENPKKEIIKIRATKDDRNKLLYCCEQLSKTQYEIVMEGINKVYNEIKK